MPYTSPTSPVGEYVAALLASQKLGSQVTCHRLLPSCEAQYAPTRQPWPAAVTRLLDERGIRGLYSHQALATDHIRAGHSVVVATPTASGKSLIYNLPVLERFLHDPDARALYLFPLKALAQDQLNVFNALVQSWPQESRPAAALYDGDTSDHFRRKIRRNPPTVLISNPEMLHLAILPHHEQWASFLAGLSFVIVDEAHTYRGVFGAHMAQVFRRLNRLTLRYGTQPVYILCTATVGNPGELAVALTGTQANPATQNPVVITTSGAPQGPRHFIFLNPEQSAATAVINLLKAALARNLRTIVYCRSRRMTELISLWTGQSGAFGKRISAYRAGFLPEERRSIEMRMASGDLLAVVTTSALELGIDIGGLDVCILAGYPGTVMATLQRGGRVGRAQQESVVIVVAGEDALDQYFARNPNDFFTRPPEKAVVNPDNDVILARHLECAAAEQPLSPGEPILQSSAARAAARKLNMQGLLLWTADGTQLVATRKRPQQHTDLRGTGQTFTIENTEGRIIGSVDGFRAWRETHPGAVYLHHGQSYVIEEVDAGRARVIAKAANVSWFTRTRGQKHTDILEELERRSIGRALVCRGRLRITDTITGYEKRSTSGNRLLTVVPLTVPPQIFETEGLWFVIPDTIRTALETQFLHFMGSIHAMEHASIGLLPLMVMADRNDFGGISTPLHPQTGFACVFIYDGLPGGAGLTRQAFPEARSLLEATLRAVEGCTCEDGCPSCVHSPKCGSGNRPISKEGALELMRQLLAPGTEGERLYCELQISQSPARLEIPDTGTQHDVATHAARTTDNTATQAQPQRTDVTRYPARNCVIQKNEVIEDSSYTPVPPPSHYVVFDVETRRSAAEVGGWHRADKMGVSIAVVYDSKDDNYYTYQQDELSGLFQQLCSAELIVGFNSFRFDYAVLRPFAPCDLRNLPGLDLLQRLTERLNYRLSLNNLGQATLCEPKSSDGIQALQWWQEGRLDSIATYCRKDVDITRRLYLYGLEHGFLLFTNKSGSRVRVPIDFRPR
ncbi:MAG: DEAD/DEAH box helicase [Desulfovibrio sp.]|nr:DEAD/DEAH box helicase [Desulfovibrio sp.]